jgi:3-hydroxyisobutyrate dehydrogenase-like beta-hydroxyacid dehydrogenase
MTVGQPAVSDDARNARGSLRVCRKAGIAPTDLLHGVNTSLFKAVIRKLQPARGRAALPPPGFTLRLGVKDLRPLLQTAGTREAPMPLASLIHDQMLPGWLAAWGERDWAAPTQVTADNAGCPD